MHPPILTSFSAIAERISVAYQALELFGLPVAWLSVPIALIAIVYFFIEIGKLLWQALRWLALSLRLVSDVILWVQNATLGLWKSIRRRFGNVMISVGTRLRDG